MKASLTHWSLITSNSLDVAGSRSKNHVLVCGLNHPRKLVTHHLLCCLRGEYGGYKEVGKVTLVNLEEQKNNSTTIINPFEEK